MELNFMNNQHISKRNVVIIAGLLLMFVLLVIVVPSEQQDTTKTDVLQQDQHQQYAPAVVEAEDFVRFPKAYKPDDFNSKEFIIRKVLNLGYDASRNQYRFNLIKRVITEDIAMPLPPDRYLSDDNLVVIDYGSNFGYFSLAIAAAFPQSVVFSVEGEIMQKYVKEGGNVPKEAADLGETTYHRLLARRLNIRNNVICKGLFSITTIASLRMTRSMFDFQIAMSIFHWLPLETRQEFEDVLREFVQLSRITVLEFPRKNHGTQYNWKNIQTWYGDRDSAREVVETALAPINAVVEDLVAGTSFRSIFKITYIDGDPFGRPSGRQLCQKLFNQFGCENMLENDECLDGDDESTSREVKPMEKKRKIPKDVCNYLKAGAIVEMPNECITDPADESPWENHGWFRCKDGSGWLSSCKQLLA